MSDSDDATRATATNIFASLVKMVPLEVGHPIFYLCFLVFIRSTRPDYRTHQSSRKNYYSDEMQKDSSLTNFWMVAGSKSIRFPYLSKLSYGSNKKRE